MIHDVRLPEHIESGAKGGPGFKTSVITLTSGEEQRNMEWSRARGEWDIGYSVQSKADYTEILRFFYARRGRAYGFRFKDWADYRARKTEIGTGDGVVNPESGVRTGTAVFPLVKSYKDTFSTYRRRITRFVAGTLKVYLNDVQTNAYSVSSNGIITFNSDSIPLAGVKITADFDFDIPVRFDIDKMDVALDWEDLGDVPDITIVEIKEL